MGHAAVIFLQNPGGRLNIKMSSYQYKDPHVKDFRTSEEIMPVRQSVLLLGMAGVHNKHKEWKES